MRLTKNKFVCNPDQKDQSFSSVALLSGTDESETGTVMSPFPSFARIPKFISSLQRIPIKPVCSQLKESNPIRKLSVRKPNSCKLEKKHISDQEEGYSEDLRGFFAHRATQSALQRKGTSRSQVTPKRGLIRTNGGQSDSLKTVPHMRADFHQAEDPQKRDFQNLRVLLNADIQKPMAINFPMRVDPRNQNTSCSPKSILKRNGAFSKLLERKDTNQSNKDSRLTLESCSHSKRSSEKRVAFTRNKLVMVIRPEEVADQMKAPRPQAPSLRTVFIKKPARRRIDQSQADQSFC